VLRMYFRFLNCYRKVLEKEEVVLFGFVGKKRPWGVVCFPWLVLRYASWKVSWLPVREGGCERTSGLKQFEVASIMKGKNEIVVSHKYKRGLNCNRMLLN